MEMENVYMNTPIKRPLEKENKKENICSSDLPTKKTKKEGPAKLLIILVIFLTICLVMIIALFVVGYRKYIALTDEIIKLEKKASSEISELKNISIALTEEIAKMRKQTSSQVSDLQTKSDGQAKNIKDLQSDSKILSNTLCKKTSANKSGFSCSPCSSTWKPYREKCYFFSNETGNWNTAYKKCIAVKSELVVINDGAEQDFLKRSLANKTYFIGLSDQSVEGKFQWVDGTDFSATDKFWAISQPTNKTTASNDDCVVLQANGMWLDTRCSVQHNWICEKASVGYFG
ncbi:C-type lectin domain family 4 member D-like isoform X2 [Protopterus annectens]|uniref:C-type lectin domain family 4 member D-like isoform X2 n=1 Tax=Protopterus annectens TaxID=7888 RepID=UPI001CFB928E|nr:C-type lectin domain family 4 member D-like isoform X2 [Protopterus annectens]